MAVDYTENVLQAIEIITDKKLRDTSFDKTIQATVVDASKAKDGIYTVFNGGTNFIAYSSETGYKENDSVMVTIPEGNYDNQKIIISKSVKSDKGDDSPLIYHSPLNNFINVSNNVITEDTSTSLLANGTYSWDIVEDNFLNALKDSNDNKPICITQQIITENAGYTHIGLRADFSTTLGVYDVISGNYGLALVVEFAQDINEIQENSNRDNINLKKAKVFLLDSSSFFGNIYNSSIGHTQEILLDISEYASNPITRISLYPYQRNNFKTINNEDVDKKYSRNTLDNSINEPDNIFIKNCYVGLGIISDSFVADRAQLYTTDTNIYSKENDKKTITLSWLHKNSEQNIATAIYEDNFPEEYNISWYRYTLGKPSPDGFVGAHWEKYQESETWLSIPENQESKMTRDFIPRQNYQREMIKVVISKDNIKIAETPILEFTNQQEVPDPNTVELLKKQAGALAIKIIDDREQGNYYVYNKAGHLISSADKIRTLQAVYDEDQPIIDYKNILNLEGCTFIEWHFPLEGMIIPIIDMGDDNLIEINQDFLNKNNNKYILNSNIQIELKESNEESNSIKMIIISSPVKELSSTIESSPDSHLVKIKYKLKYNLLYPGIRSYAYLQIIKDNTVYTASTAMSFNTFGTSGSGYTISIEWDNDINYPVFDFATKNDLTGTIILRENFHQQIVSLNDDAEYNVSWYEPQQSIKDVRYLSPGIDERDKIYIGCPKSGTLDTDKFMNQLYILEIVLIGFGDYELKAYFPIALKNTYTNISTSTSIIAQNYKGPTIIRYASDGTIDFNDESCDIKTFSNNNQKLRWKAICFPNVDNMLGLPKFDETLNKILPQPIYYSNLPIYGVQCYVNSGDIIWTQPIYIYRDNYPSTTLNEWDGKDIKLNEKEGIIVAHGFAAGKKDQDNTFSGVVLGDWSLTDSGDELTTNTGIYGFHQGKMSYAFKDDGTAFIGSDATGRINFDGNEGTIESADFSLEEQTGFQIDLTNEALYLFGNKNSLNLDSVYSITLNSSPKEKNTPIFQIGRMLNINKEINTVTNGLKEEYKISINNVKTSYTEIYNKIKEYKNFDNYLADLEKDEICLKSEKQNNNFISLTEYIMNLEKINILEEEKIKLPSIIFDLYKFGIGENYEKYYAESINFQTYKNYSFTDDEGKIWEIDEDGLITFLTENCMANIIDFYIKEIYQRYKGNTRGDRILLIDAIKKTYPGLVNQYDFPGGITGAQTAKKYESIPIEFLNLESDTLQENHCFLDITFENDFLTLEGKPVKDLNNNILYYKTSSIAFYPGRGKITQLKGFIYNTNKTTTTILFVDNIGTSLNSRGNFIPFTIFFSDKTKQFSFKGKNNLGSYDYFLDNANLKKGFCALRSFLRQEYLSFQDFLFAKLPLLNLNITNVKGVIDKINDLKINPLEDEEKYSYNYSYTIYIDNDNSIPYNDINLLLLMDASIFSSSFKQPESDIQFIFSDWENNLISISPTGGYLTSMHYRPTVLNMNKNLLPTDNQMPSSVYSSNTYGMKGFIIDLTNDKIVLGNNSAIVGYQSGSWHNDPSPLREFSISTGADFGLSDSNGVEFIHDNKNFIVAKQNQEVVFKVDWFGNVYCKTINTQ